MTKTSEAPQRVVLHFNDPSADGGLEGWWHVCDGANGTGLGWYVPENHAQAMVAAAYEAAKEVAANRVAVCEDEERRDRDGIGASCRLEADLILRRIHAMIPDDARAALDAMLAEEREKALREAAAAIPLPETGNAGPPQDATDRLLDAQRRSDKEAILALIDKPADPGAP